MSSYSIVPSGAVGGGKVDLTISAPGEHATITFDGTAGHRISIQINAISFSGSAGAADFSIANPDATAGPAAAQNAASVLFDYVLPQTGTYTLTVAPWTSGTGTAEVEFYTSVDVAAAITPTLAGAVLAVNLPTPGQAEIVSFPGASGESLTIAASAWALGTKTVKWIRPDSSTFYSNNVNSANSGTATLDATGTWQFVITTYVSVSSRDAHGTCTLTFTGTAPVLRTFTPAGQSQSPVLGGAIARTFAASQAQAVQVGSLMIRHILPVAIASEAVVGRPLLEDVGQLVRPASIASAEAVGLHDVEIVAEQNISLYGRSWIDPEAVGKPTIGLPGVAAIYPSGFAHDSGVGVPVLMGGLGNPSPVGPRRVPRNVLIDRKTHEVYPWPLNHSSEDALRSLGRRITRSGITASGKLLATRRVFLIKHLSSAGPARMMLHGTLMDRTPPTQYQKFVQFFQNCDDRTFDFVDASSDAYHVIIVQFDARRRNSKAHTDGSYFDYSLECEILDVYSGALAGHTR